MAISLATKDFVQGGLLNDVDVEVLESRFVIYDYEGKANLSADPPLALKLVLKVDDDTEHTEYITGGSSKDFIPNPNDDGDTIEKNGSASNLRKGSNLFLFNQSLEEAGFPQAKLAEGKSSVYKGIKFHLERRASPKRQGIRDDSEKEKTYIACGQLISVPWDTKGKAKAAAKPANSTAKPAAKPAPAAAPVEDDEDMTNKAMEYASTVLAEYAEAGEVNIQKFKMGLFRVMTGVDQATKNAITALAVSEDVLGVLGWAVGGEKKDKLVIQ